MEKEEILAKAQGENKGKDVADIEAQRRGAYSAYFVGLCLICIWDLVDVIIFNRINCGGNMVLFAMGFTAFLTKYLKQGKKHELAVAIFYGFCMVAFLVLWILQLVGVMPR